MKVGTDSVILGAWVSLDGVTRILDIGTGTGLLALMVAQRNPSAQVTAVEIDPAAASQARENVNASPFKQRITIQEGDIKAITGEIPQPFDLIICNPPYFPSGLQSPSAQRTIARHSTSLGLEELIRISGELLSPSTGRLGLILPSESAEKVLEFGRKQELLLHRHLDILPTPGKAPKRVCLELGRGEVNAVHQELVIEEFGRHGYSRQYRELTSAFYL